MYWILTDPHFLHDKLIEYGRPADFSDRISKNWDRVIVQGDVVICLGDVAVGRDEEAHLRYVVPRPGTKILVKGNHDKKSNEWYLARGWHFVINQFMLKRMGMKVLFSHIPQPDLGHFDLNIHGHFHDSDHRSKEPLISALLTPKHHLLAMELHGYAPLKLDSVLLPISRGIANGSKP